MTGPTSPDSVDYPIITYGLLGPDAPATPTPVRVWAGAVTENGFKVNYDVSSDVWTDVEIVSLVVSNRSNLSSPIYEAPSVSPNVSLGVSTIYVTGAFEVTGLQPDTVYYYGPVVNGISFPSLTGQVRTAPTPGTAKTFKFGLGSCINAAYRLDNVWSAISAEELAFFLFVGDIAYPDVSVNDAKLQRDSNTRAFRNMSNVQAMLLTTPWVYMFDDHDSAGDDNHWDKLYASNATNNQIVTNSRTVYRETTPAYSQWNDKVLGQTWNWGRTRFVMPDLRSQRRYQVGTPTIFGNGTNPPSSFDQLSYVLAEITDAVADGVKLLFFVSSSTWYPAVFDSWQTNYTADQQTIANAIRDANVQVIFLHGDSHQCGIDDGTYTDKSSTLTAKYPLVMSSALWQGGVFDVVQPLEWNGTDGDITGPTPTSTPPGTGNANAYCTIEVQDNGGNDIHFEIVFKGAPISSGVATVLGAQSAYRDDDATPAVGFADATTLNIVTGSSGDLEVEKSWLGPVAGCSATYTWASGPTGTVTWTPNSSQAIIVKPYTTGLGDTVTISAPVRCSLAGITSKTIAYYTPNAATTAYTAAMTTQPTTTQLAALDALIVGLIADGVWAKVMNMWWTGAPTQQASLLDMKTPGSNTLVPVGTVQYAALQGWRGSNVGSGTSTLPHLETNVAIAGARQNDIAMFVWALDAKAAWGEMGGDYYYVNPNGSTAEDYRMRSSSQTTDSVGNAVDVPGMIGWTRTGAANYTIYENGVSAGVVTRTSSAPNATTMWVCGFNNTASGGGLCQSGGRRIPMAVISTGLTGPESLALYNRWNTFLQAVGTI